MNELNKKIGYLKSKTRKNIKIIGILICIFLLFLIAVYNNYVKADYSNDNYQNREIILNFDYYNNFYEYSSQSNNFKNEFITNKYLYNMEEYGNLMNFQTNYMLNDTYKVNQYAFNTSKESFRNSKETFKATFDFENSDDLSYWKGNSTNSLNDMVGKANYGSSLYFTDTSNTLSYSAYSEFNNSKSGWIEFYVFGKSNSDDYNYRINLKDEINNAISISIEPLDDGYGLANVKVQNGNSMVLIDILDVEANPIHFSINYTFSKMIYKIYMNGNYEGKYLIKDTTEYINSFHLKSSIANSDTAYYYLDAIGISDYIRYNISSKLFNFTGNKELKTIEGFTDVSTDTCLIENKESFNYKVVSKPYFNMRYYRNSCIMLIDDSESGHAGLREEFYSISQEYGYIEFWFFINDNSKYFSLDLYSGGSPLYFAWIYYDDGTFFNNAGGSWQEISGLPEIESNEWYHVSWWFRCGGADVFGQLSENRHIFNIDGVNSSELLPRAAKTSIQKFEIYTGNTQSSFYMLFDSLGFSYLDDYEIGANEIPETSYYYSDISIYFYDYEYSDNHVCNFDYSGYYVLNLNLYSYVVEDVGFSEIIESFFKIYNDSIEIEFGTLSETIELSIVPNWITIEIHSRFGYDKTGTYESTQYLINVKINNQTNYQYELYNYDIVHTLTYTGTTISNLKSECKFINITNQYCNILKYNRNFASNIKDNYNFFDIFPNILERIDLIEQPDLPDIPDVPDAPEPPEELSQTYWKFLSFGLEFYKNETIFFRKDMEVYNQTINVNSTYKYPLLQSTMTEGKFYYNTESVKKKSLGNWKFKFVVLTVDLNLIRDTLCLIINFIAFIFQIIYFLVIVAFNFVIMYLVLGLLVPFLWNVIIFWIFYGLVFLLFITILFFVYIWNLILVIFYWTVENLEPIIRWLAEALVVFFAFIIAIILWLASFGKADFDDLYAQAYEFTSTISDFMVDTFLTLLENLPAVFLYIVMYVILIGFCLLKHIYCKAKGLTNRSNQLKESYEAYLYPILFVKKIVISLKDFIGGWF